MALERVLIEQLNGWVEGVRGQTIYFVLNDASKSPWNVQEPITHFSDKPEVGDAVYAKIYQCGRVKVAEYRLVKPAALTPEEEEKIRKKVNKLLGSRGPEPV